MRTVAHAAIVVSIAFLAGCDGDGVDGNPPDLNGWRELRIRDSGSTTMITSRMASLSMRTPMSS